MHLQAEDYCIDDGMRQDVFITHRNGVKHLFPPSILLGLGQLKILSIMINSCRDIHIIGQTLIA